VRSNTQAKFTIIVINTRLMRRLYEAYEELMRSLCEAYAELMRSLCGAYAELMRSLCEAYAELMLSFVNTIIAIIIFAVVKKKHDISKRI
jgi:hypothetical protein